MNIIVGILGIDRDIHNLKKLIDLIKYDIVLITREMDLKVINFIKEFRKIKLIVVPNYEIKERHNVENIAMKRQIIINYSRDNNYDYLLFCDSDMLLPDNCIEDMIEISKNNNNSIVCGIYPVVWGNGKAIIFTNKGLKEYKDINEKDKIIIGGFGCTLINSRFFNIPIKISSIKLNDNTFLTGEDFGWYIELYNRNIVVKPYLKSIITHNYVQSNNELKPYNDDELNKISLFLLEYFKNHNI